MSDTTFISTSITPASSAGESSTSKLKRQSMNTVPSGSLPRPLQLGSTTSFSSNSPSPRPSSYAAESTTPVTGASSRNSDGLASPSPLSPTITNLKRGAQKRQSSISYIASGSPSQSQFSRHDTSDVSSLNLARSPLSSAHTTTSFSPRSPGLGRSNSVGGVGKGSTPSSRMAGERSSTGSLLATGNGKEPEQKERPPLTLADKHADLLHFIAQKESKCLELRSQLAAHEAELAQLKRKWERIVNRGFEKSQSPSSVVPSSPSPTPTSLNASATPPSTNQSYASSNGPLPGAVVLEGIKESVQGVSRLIAAGLESIGGTTAPSSAYSVTTDASSSTIRGAPLPLRLGRNIAPGHMQKDSQSSSTSVSTATSRSTNRSSWLSASTASSSATSGTDFSESWGSSSGTDTNANVGTTTSNMTRTEATEEEESEFGDFEDGQERVQVLMVRDTGATPTMSPNPDFQRRQKRAARIRSVSPSPGPAATRTETMSLSGLEVLAGQSSEAGSSQANSTSVSAGLKEEFDWDDGWDEPVSEAQASDSARSASASVYASTYASSSAVAESTGSATTTTANGNGFASHPSPGSGAKSPLAAMSSIPGLATISTVGSSTVAAQQMSSWVGSVGKKWGEISRSSTFTKNQKRASLLISDMQQTLVSALISPPAPSSGPPSESSYSISSNDPHHAPMSSPSSFSSNAFDFIEQSTSSSNVQSPAPKPKLPLTQPQGRRAVSARSTSLLDESDDESFGGPVGDQDSTVRMRLGMGAPVLVPVSIKAQPATTPKTRKASNGSVAAVKKKKQEEPEEEWNW
ncbi:unnamed protein product [Cyclocybe aegerita]|uniref:Uncharacterized protein n=1 Tax=Cyclocybe aegerita TaxID=1973307 RepID=A0A8S0XIX9_CYCAE|nr:unnamed protein product [Cyclocybe aegerita]